MRMSDGPSVEVEVSIEASPERVWEMVTDIVGMGDWSPEYDGGEWLDGASGPTLGARFRGRNRRLDRKWESVSTVVEAEPGRSFAWAVDDPANPGATWRFDLTPEGAGTRVRQYVRLGPGPSGLTRRIEQVPDREERIVQARVDEHRRNMETTLQSMKSAAERVA
jgi:uncharacterized protein YndB with AHSA1/START domain